MVAPTCYSSNNDSTIRHRFDISGVIPRNETICFSPNLYRVRNLVERFFNRIKHCRHVTTRYDKLAANYLAFVQLHSLRLWLRANESTAWSLWGARRDEFLRDMVRKNSGRPCAGC